LRCGANYTQRNESQYRSNEKRDRKSFPH
jgi:hypothetical protein